MFVRAASLPGMPMAGAEIVWDRQRQVGRELGKLGAQQRSIPGLSAPKTGNQLQKARSVIVGTACERIW
jgi:hypothetical protein